MRDRPRPRKTPAGIAADKDHCVSRLRSTDFILTEKAEDEMADDEKSMDERRKEMADKIITDMVLDNKDAESIAEQKKVNKETLGHEGSANVEQH
jgi:hypothetical protein